MNQTILLTVCLSLFVLSQTKNCGEGPAIATFEADVLNKIPSDAQGFAALKEQYNEWKKSSAVEIAQGKVQEECKSFFVGKKTCCKEGTLTLLRGLFKMHIGALLNAAGDNKQIKKANPLGALRDKIGDVVKKCENAGKTPDSPKPSTPPPSANATLPSNVNLTALLGALNFTNMTMTPSNSSASIKMSMSMSMSMSGLNSGLLQAMKKVGAEEAKIGSLLKLGYAQIALGALRLFRGTHCTICMDPDAPITEIWDGGARADQAQVDELKENVRKSLVAINEALKRGLENAKFEVKVSNKKAPCQAADQAINDAPAVLNLCKDDPDCSKTAASFVVSAFTLMFDKLVQDQPTTTSRFLQTSSIQPVANGPLKAQVSDPAEDNTVTIDGQNLDAIKAADAQADTEVKAAGAVDYNQAAAAAGANSNILFGLIAILAIFFN